MKWKYILLVVFLLFLSVFYLNQVKNKIVENDTNGVYLNVNNEKIILEVADTYQKKVKGLSDRQFLDENTGMIFLYEESGNYGIWMNDMNFPIDIFWLDENFKVITIKEKVATTTYPLIFYPDRPAKYILEFNSGFAKKMNIALNDVLDISLSL